jgi:hypothetical protein
MLHNHLFLLHLDAGHVLAFDISYQFSGRVDESFIEFQYM